MPLLFTPSHWETQPAYHVPVDRNHPFARGLILSIDAGVSGAPYDQISRRVGVGVQRKATRAGIGYSCASVTNVACANFDFEAVNNRTIAIHITPDAIATNWKNIFGFYQNTTGASADVAVHQFGFGRANSAAIRVSDFGNSQISQDVTFTSGVPCVLVAVSEHVPGTPSRTLTVYKDGALVGSVNTTANPQWSNDLVYWRVGESAGNDVKLHSARAWARALSADEARRYSLAVLDVLTPDVVPINFSAGGGTTYNETITETATPSDSLSTALTALASLSESSTAADAYSTILTALASISEAATAADAYTALLDAIATLSEAASAADAYADSLGSSTYNETIAEAATAADAYATALTALASLAESSAAADSVSAVLTAVAAITEVATAADAYSATGLFVAAAERTLGVRAETRTLTVALETRTFKPALETRTLTV